MVKSVTENNPAIRVKWEIRFLIELSELTFIQSKCNMLKLLDRDGLIFIGLYPLETGFYSCVAMQFVPVQICIPISLE